MAHADSPNSPSGPSREQVVAVVAAYSPAAALIATVEQLLRQVHAVVVVDDGSPAGSETVLAGLEAAGAVVVRQPANSGIAAALNAGIAEAGSRWHPAFYLTLDQDSRPSEHYVQSALETYRQAVEASVPVGFVCAASYSGHPVPVLRREGSFVHAFDPMQSGFLLPRSTVDRLGPFEAGLFIDGVDSEFTMRTRTAGLAVLVGAGCDIEHDLGQRQPGRLFGVPVRIRGREISYNYHSPSRVYYICRNGTVLSRRYFRRAPRWVLRRLLEESKAHLLRFAFSPGRRTLLRAALAGFSDALRGRNGRIPADLERRLR